MLPEDVRASWKEPLERRREGECIDMVMGMATEPMDGTDRDRSRAAKTCPNSGDTTRRLGQNRVQALQPRSAMSDLKPDDNNPHIKAARASTTEHFRAKHGKDSHAHLTPDQ